MAIRRGRTASRRRGISRRAAEAAAACAPPFRDRWPRRRSCRLGERDMDSSGFVRHAPGPPDTAQCLGHRQAGLQPVLMETGAEIGAAEPAIALPLEVPDFTLSADRRL